MSAQPAFQHTWLVTQSQPWHVARMLPRIRDEDRRELWTGWRHTPEYSLRYGLTHSSHCWTALVDFEPILMVGVVPASIIGGAGCPWLIGTDAMEGHQVGFLRRCRPHMRRIRSMYSRLHNFVAADNAVAVRWLEWLQFTVGEPIPYGPDGTLFRRFEWCSDV